MSRPQTKSAMLIYIVLLCVIYATPVPLEEVGLYDGAGWTARLTYQHFHASVFHLLCNAWALLVFTFQIRTPARLFAVAYVISATYPFVGESIIVGVSGLIYAVAGMYAFCFYTMRRFYTYNLFFAVTILLGGLFSHVAIGLHAYCYLVGAAFAFVFIPIRVPFPFITKLNNKGNEHN